jgi:hypothetical protein
MGMRGSHPRFFFVGRCATNKPLAALGHVVHDGDLAEALLDR